MRPISITPMSRALLQLFDDLSRRLAARGVPPGAVHAFLFGGCAVHLHSQARVSNDVDVEFALDQPIYADDLGLILHDLPPLDFEDPDEGPSLLAFDPQFNTTLGPLHMDYRDRAVRLPFESTSPLIVWLPSPEDIALSKLGRLTEIDLEDILKLLALPGSSWDFFEQLTNEARAYFVGPDLTSNLEYVRANWIRRFQS